MLFEATDAPAIQHLNSTLEKGLHYVLQFEINVS